MITKKRYYRALKKLKQLENKNIRNIEDKHLIKFLNEFSLNERTIQYILYSKDRPFELIKNTIKMIISKPRRCDNARTIIDPDIELKKIIY